MGVCLLNNKREELFLSYILNELYSGYHGIIKSLLQTIAHYFIAKENGNNQLASVLIKRIIEKLEFCIIISNLSEEVGVQISILKRKDNLLESCKENKKFYKARTYTILAEQIVYDFLIIKNCEKVIEYYKNQKVIEALEQIINKIRQGVNDIISIYGLKVYNQSIL